MRGFLTSRSEWTCKGLFDASFCQNAPVVPVSFLIVCRPHVVILLLDRVVAAFFTGHGSHSCFEVILLKTCVVFTNDTKLGHQATH